MVQESELEAHAELGTGAFGTVHRGTWKPPSKNNEAKQVKVKVAIKTLNEPKASILQEGTGLKIAINLHYPI